MIGLIGGLGGGGRFRRLRGLGILMEAAGGRVKSRRRVGCGGYYDGLLALWRYSSCSGTAKYAFLPVG